eukprot:12433443-Alexandrium_andersonii.AAC.1
MEVEGGDSDPVPSANPAARCAHVPWVEAGSTALESFIPKAPAPCAPAPAVGEVGERGAVGAQGVELSDEQLSLIHISEPTRLALI